jgi:hypothetical protein
MVYIPSKVSEISINFRNVEIGLRKSRDISISVMFKFPDKFNYVKGFPFVWKLIVNYDKLWMTISSIISLF